MVIIFDIVFFLYGIYAIYAAINMKKTQQLSSFFTGGDNSPIRDVGGYINAIYGKTIVMGAMAALFGAVGFINDYVTPISAVMKALMLLFLTVVIWFGVSLNRAKREFW